MYTKEGAEIAGFEKLGQLKEGYKGSFVILSEDILNVAGKDIERVYVEETYINGDCVYKKK